MPIPNQDLDFERQMSWCFFTFIEFCWDVVVRFVDNGGLLTINQCLNFAFIMYMLITDMTTLIYVQD